MCCTYTDDDMHIVSAGSDQTIFVWSVAVGECVRKLRGHTDIIYRCVVTHNGSFVVSCSHDSTLKTWQLTPREPDRPDKPTIIDTTHDSAVLTWKAPPSFNEPITAFHIQIRLGSTGEWTQPPVSVPPSYRQKTYANLMPARLYTLRVCAENRIGRSKWSHPSAKAITLSGLPKQILRPVLTEISATSMRLHWFAPAATAFGESVNAFTIQESGAGLDFDAHTERTLSWAHCRAEGTKLQAKLFEYSSTNRSIAGLTTEELKSLCHTCTASYEMLCSAVVEGLESGEAYRFRVRGLNSGGAGQFSEPSYTLSTLPGVPSTPEPPVLKEAKPRSLVLTWHAPKDNGSAVLGYRLFLPFVDSFRDLGRWETEHEIDNLYPGEGYQLALAARNSVGWSQKSFMMARTTTAPPSMPARPIVLTTTSTAGALRVCIPYGNGAVVDSLVVETKLIHPFERVPWEYHSTVPVATAAVFWQQESQPAQAKAADFNTREEHKRVTAPAYKRSNMGKRAQELNAMGMLPHRVRRPGGALFLSQREQNGPAPFPPPADTGAATFTIHGLLSDSDYEFRVAARNANGDSVFSAPSLRTRTQKAELPMPYLLQVQRDVPYHTSTSWEPPTDEEPEIVGDVVE
jgi:hypothetical protein